MKTVQSSSAQKANMRSAQKNKTATPSSDKKNVKEQTSGKKLIQARLPFKILTGTPPSIPHGGVHSPGTVEVPSKKRKLSYTEDDENPKKIGKSESKENFTHEQLDKCTALAEDIVVVLSDEDTTDESKNESSCKTPAAVASQSKERKNTPRSASGTSTTPKLQIKLPLGGKKKRKTKRASPSTKTEASDGSDVELVSDVQQNPQKKVKLDDQPQNSTKGNSALNVDVVNENEKEVQTSLKPSSSPKEHILKKKVEKEADPQTPKTSKHKCSPKTSEKLNKPAESEPESSKNKEANSPKRSSQKLSESISSRDEQNKSKENNDKEEQTEENSQTKISSPSKVSPKEDTASGSSENEKAASPTIDSKSDKTKQDSTPSRENKTSRRSARIAEAEVDLTSEEKSNPADTSITKDSHNKMLTPKQIKLMELRKKAREEKELKLQQLKEERERKLQEQREERERKLQEEKMQKQKEREERERKLQEEKMQKQKEREERELLRKKEREEKEDQKRREREEKDEQRKKEKEDKERKRLAELEAKNEEKRKKDELKEEERRKKEEEENKKKKAAQAFTKFFVPKTVKPGPDEDQDSRDDAESVDSLAFRPFQVKGDMKMAPLVRQHFNKHKREKLDSFLKSDQPHESALYLSELKNGSHTPLKGSKTVVKITDDNEDDVILIETELENAAQTIIDETRAIPIQKYKTKYYLFRENRRPPFYGTWRKKSTVITPRKPFALDKTFFDYEVDSDDEWEEEEPGESLNGSEDEKESEDDDYEVDNEWFVPHGHLSDEEMQNEDELGPDTSREAQKAKLKALQQEFAQEMKKKTKKIKPRLIGAIWEDENGNRPELCPPIIWDSLCSCAMMFSEQIIIEEPEVIQPDPSPPPPEKQKRIDINEELMGDLVRLVHGNRHSRDFLIKEYLEHLSSKCETIKSGECLAPTKAQIKEKIYEISKWSVVNAVNKKNKNRKKLCWVVPSDVLEKYSLDHLGVRNEWSYKLQPKFDKDKKDEPEVKEIENDTAKEESKVEEKPAKGSNKKHNSSRITNFTRVLTNEEKQSQLTASKSSASPIVKTKNPSKTTPVVTPKSKTIKKSASPSEDKTVLSSNTPNKPPTVKKRVALLMSVAPGQEFSQKSKNALISQFLQKNKTAKSTLRTTGSKVSPEPDPCASSTIQMDVDEVVVLE